MVCIDAKLIYGKVNSIMNHIGTIPSTIGSLTNLVQLLLHNNCLGGMYLMIKIMINTLIACFKIITGTIPCTIGSLLKVNRCRNLRKQTNRFVAEFNSIIHFEFHINYVGTIPSSIASLTSLSVLSLGANSLIGKL